MENFLNILGWKCECGYSRERTLKSLPKSQHSLKVRAVLFEFHLKFGIPPVLVFQLEVYYKVDRLLTGLTAQQKGTTARWYSNKTSLSQNNF